MSNTPNVEAGPQAGDAVAPASSPVDRAISPVAGRSGVGQWGKGATLAALVIGCGAFLAATQHHDARKASPATKDAVRQVVPFEPAAPHETAPTLDHPDPGAPSLGPPGPSPVAGPLVPALEPSATTAGEAAAPPQTAAARRASQVLAMRNAPMLVFGQANPPSEREPPATAASPAPPAPSTQKDDAPTELDQLRHTSAIGLSRAHRLPDRDFLIAAGTTIPCTLQTAMDTATPGYVSCLIGQDVYSDNGAVVLMEKGTKVMGEYHSGLRQGQTRLFVLWTRAVTPTGVAIGLASPASDPLGRAGFDGAIDSHFWARFGGALMLSIVDDGGAALSARTDPNSETVHLPSSAAATALQNTVNIPPSLVKAQGALVTIFAAQDFDFSGVYALKRRP